MALIHRIIWSQGSTSRNNRSAWCFQQPDHTTVGPCPKSGGPQAPLSWPRPLRKRLPNCLLTHSNKFATISTCEAMRQDATTHHQHCRWRCCICSAVGSGLRFLDFMRSPCLHSWWPNCGIPSCNWCLWRGCCSQIAVPRRLPH